MSDYTHGFWAALFGYSHHSNPCSSHAAYEKWRTGWTDGMDARGLVRLLSKVTANA